jgi:hypothetical protein
MCVGSACIFDSVHHHLRSSTTRLTGSDMQFKEHYLHVREGRTKITLAKARCCNA